MEYNTVDELHNVIWLSFLLRSLGMFCLANTEKETDRLARRHAGRDRQTNNQTDGKINRQKDGQTDGQTDRQQRDTFRIWLCDCK